MEMAELITTSNIVFALGILGVIFSVYNYFRSPQELLERKQLVAEEDLKDKATILSQKEVENKAELLARQVQWDKDANAVKFKEMQDNFYLLLKQSDNHLHTIEENLNKHIVDNNSANLVNATNFTKIFTLIDERIPKTK